MIVWVSDDVGFVTGAAPLMDLNSLLLHFDPWADPSRGVCKSEARRK